MKINVLTPGPTSYNGRAFLYPLMMHKILLKTAGYKFAFVSSISDELTDCSLLLIDSKFFREWWLLKKGVLLDLLAQWKEKTRVFFFDTTDSSGFILGEVLPHVEKYLKHQILVDKTAYLRPLYGRRKYSDYYHNKYGVDDDPKHEESFSQVKEMGDLKKIKVGWNTGVANYSLLGEYYGRLLSATNSRFFLRAAHTVTSNFNNKNTLIHCRMNLIYDKASVSFQRNLLAKKMAGYLDSRKVNRWKYFKELEKTKIVISPFGLGEITLKDFEAFLCNCILLKPNMDHMETWPNFYIKDKTYIGINWDFSDLGDVLERLSSNYKDYLCIAAEAQETYARAVFLREAGEVFLKRFEELVS